MSRTYADYAHDLAGAPRRLRRILREEIATKAAKDAQKRAKLRVLRRFVNRTGNLRRSVRGRVQLLNRGFGIALSAGGPNVPYARVHELGGTSVIRPTQPHGFLVFTATKGRFKGQTIFLRREVIVKNRARHYLRDTIRAVQADMREDLTRAIRGSILFEGVSGG